MSRTWSPQQIAIFDWFKNPDRKKAVVRARAGTGKTTTIIEGLNHASETRILLSAFNKRIAEELQARLTNPYAEAKTLHGLGFQFVRRNWERVNVDNGRGKRLAQQACGMGAPDAMIALVAKLAGLGKEMAPLSKNPADLVEIAYQMDVLPDPEWEEEGWTVERIAGYAQKAMSLALTRDGSIDFSDMLYLPLAHGWVRPVYDLVCIDECFPGDTPILLADGTTRPIREIVEGKQAVSVLSYDEATGKQVIKSVTNWKKVLLQKKTYRITVRQIAYGEKGKRLAPGTERARYGIRHLVCTADHRIWTMQGWTEAQHLTVGARVQVESDAPRSDAYNHKYKHTISGKRTLGKSISGRNARGVMHKGSNKGTRPPIQGGNGKGLTVPQATLLSALGDNWASEYVVPTRKGRGNGYPTCYKIDIAHPGCKIAIEVDGQGHKGARKKLDEKKDAFLSSIGWTVYRISNLEAVRDAEKIAASLPKNCPVEGEVVAVEECPIEDYYVYDLTVDDTHCYYAHGILVHNCQDMNAAQIELATRSATKTGRIIVVGDDRQAIYGFRGADSGSLDRLKATLGAEELPLTITYRCAQSIVSAAQALVPDYQAAPSAKDGIVRVLGAGKLPQEAKPGDFVISRKNAPLVRVCLSILRTGTRAKVEGRDIGRNLLALIRKLKAKSMPDFLKKLGAWVERETKRLANVKPEIAERKGAEIEDTAETLRVLADGLSGLPELEARIEHLFADDVAAGRSGMVVCSTIHRVKGLEADRAFILRGTLATGKRAGNREEMNCEYVAITRAKNELIWVEGEV
jgi:superfamily I DNA/RNA helicase